MLIIAGGHMVLLCIGFSYGCPGLVASRAGHEGPSVYFVDSRSGKDENEGRSGDKPWKSLLKLEGIGLGPGDSIRFKRGSEFTGTVYISGSGTRDRYITLTDYGDPGLPPPAFTNPFFDPEDRNFGNCIRLEGSYTIVEHLYFHHTVADLPGSTGGFETMWQLGAVYVDHTAAHCIVRDNEIRDCGAGIRSYGPHTLIERNYIHDCNRVLKKWNWGPIGIWLGADFQEVRYNRIFNYSVVDPRIGWGPESYGGGADGGAIEIDDARYAKSHISIHHNFTRDCQGFLEVTWTDVEKNPDYSNFRIHHNVSDDYQQFVALWRGAGCRIENNTVIRRRKNANDWGVFNITQDSSGNYIRNNIVVVADGVVVYNIGKEARAVPCSIIENNLYYACSGPLLMGREGPGAGAITGDPRFLNDTGGSSPGDFSLRAGSPAINRGKDLSYTLDFAGTAIPQGGLPDIGAFEYPVTRRKEP